MLQRGDVKIADQDCPFFRGPQLGASAHVVQERKLMGKLGIDLRIWFVAACRYVEVMHSDRITQTRLIGKGHRDMTGICLTAEASAIDRRERQSRDDGD